MKIRKNDQVLIISGKDKNRKGKVIETLPKQGKVVVEGINLRKKHIKPKKSGEKGQIVTVPGPFDASDVKIICPKCNKATRIGYQEKKKEDKNKVRMCKKCKSQI